MNLLLRDDYRAGFPFDKSHEPHLTLVQRYIERGDLAAVTSVIEPIAQSEQVVHLSLTATGYELAGSGNKDLAIVLMAVDRWDDLRRLQQRIADAVEPFAVSGGGADAADAFVLNDDG